MKVDELRELEEDQLADRMKTARRELYELRFKHAVGQLENSSQISKVRHDIARIMTVRSERELGLVTFVPHDATATAAAAAAPVAVAEKPADEGFEPDAQAEAPKPKPKRTRKAKTEEPS
jgi:large subunit ribosomal protein L29